MFTKIADFWSKYNNQIFEGLQITLYISMMGILIGLMMGILIGYLRNVHISRKDNLIIRSLKYGVKYILDGYIAFFRYTPFVAQIFFAWYGLFLTSGITRISISIFVLAANTAAFQAKVIEGGIKSIDDGQYLAGRSLGFSHRRTFFTIVLPQASRNMVPGFSNEWVNVIKATSVLTIIGVADLMGQIQKYANAFASEASDYMAAYAISLIIYFIVCFAFVFILKMFNWWLERRW